MNYRQSLRALFEAVIWESEFEKASDVALDKAYGYGLSHDKGTKHDFGRAANRSSAARALRYIRAQQRAGKPVDTEAGADVVHQGWAHTATNNPNQTPEKKAKRAVLAATPYDKLDPAEQEKDRVSFNAVHQAYKDRMAKQRESIKASFKKIVEELSKEEQARVNKEYWENEGKPFKGAHEKLKALGEKFKKKEAEKKKK